MRILYIWDADYPWDIRVEKICKSLIKNGNEVHIAARNLKKLPEFEIINDFYIHRLKQYRNNRVNYALSFPAFFNPIWKKFLNKIIRERKIDLIIVRDLPMAIAGIWAGKRNNIPVIFDMAENYVSMIKDIWENRKFKGFNLVVRNPYLAKLVEKYVFKHINHIIVVVEEAKNIVLQAGRKSADITIVGNTPSKKLFVNNKTHPYDEFKLIQNRFSVIYTGGIQLGRGIQVVFKAIPEIINEIPDFLFVIIGDGYATNQLKKLTAELKIQKYVNWIGWVAHEKIYNYINVSKVGIIPHFRSGHTDTTIPNKIFDYMGCGLPVISSDMIPMKRIIEEEKCGVVFKSGEYKDISRAILEVFHSEHSNGINGKKAVMEKYNWEEDEQRLCKLVNEFLHPFKKNTTEKISKSRDNGND